jgi:hypothetical protein
MLGCESAEKLDQLLILCQKAEHAIERARTRTETHAAQ